jgi:hypothetical protein
MSMTPDELKQYHKEYSRLWYLRNKDKVKAKSSNWYSENKSQKLEVGNTWRKHNSDHINAKVRENYSKDLRAEYTKEWRSKNPDKVLKRIAKCAISKTTGLSSNQIPDVLVDIKVDHLKIRRVIKGFVCE